MLKKLFQTYSWKKSRKIKVIEEREYASRKDLHVKIIKLLATLYFEEPVGNIEKYVEKCIRDRERRRIYVLMVDRQVCGVAIFNIIEEKIASLMEIVVHPRRRGYGTIFLEMLKERFRREGINRITVPVIVSNEEIRCFYLKNGFKKTAHGGMELDLEEYAPNCY